MGFEDLRDIIREGLDSDPVLATLPDDLRSLDDSGVLDSDWKDFLSFVNGDGSVVNDYFMGVSDYFGEFVGGSRFGPSQVSMYSLIEHSYGRKFMRNVLREVYKGVSSPLSR